MRALLIALSLLIATGLTVCGASTTCYPHESYVSTDQLGCGNPDGDTLQKTIYYAIVWPDGIIHPKKLTGYGECRLPFSCTSMALELAYRAAGPVSCWPWFKPAVITGGRWSKTVQDRRALIKPESLCFTIIQHSDGSVTEVENGFDFSISCGDLVGRTHVAFDTHTCAPCYPSPNRFP
jgi:hypothetical protein